VIMPNHVLIVVQTSPLPTPPEVIQKLVSVADQLAENATAAVFRRHLATREVGRLLQDMEDRARELQRGWDAEAEQMAQVCTAAAAQAGLELKLAEIGLGGDPIEELTALARSHDYSVLPIGPTVEDEYDVLAALLHGAGRPVVLIPDRPPSTSAARWAHAVVAWTPSAKAARALKDATPLLLKARTVSILVVREEGAESNVDRALDAVRYLETRGIKSSVVSLPAGGQRIGLRISRFMDENSADLLVMGAPSKPHEADFRLHSKGLDVMEEARWVILIST
jgi:nucleotide-binding universal stress UspA family protein